MHRKNRKSLKEHIRYYSDLWLSKGTVSMAVLLFAITGLMIIILSALIKLFCIRQGLSFREALWQTLNHALDPGVLSGDNGTAVFLFLMFLATICGVIFMAMLIGVVNDGISSRIAELSKGLDPVIENDHVVILGFNDATFSIIEELIKAYENQSRKRNAIVVMDRFDKQEMEERIRTLFPDTKNAIIVCRSGETYNQTDLARCSIVTSKSIIVALENDFETIKTIIACTQALNEDEDSKAFVTATINQKRHELAARIAGDDKDHLEGSLSVVNDRLEMLMLETITSKIITHTSRQRGLSKVFLELFNYANNEIYIVRNEDRDKEVFEKLSGKTVREINQHLHNAIAIGIIDSQGNVIIDNPNKVILQKDCKLIVLEEDDNKIILGDEVLMQGYKRPVKQYEDRPVSILIVDCNSKLPMILEELCNYINPGSTIHLFSDPIELDAITHHALPDSLIDYNGVASIEIKRCEPSPESDDGIYDYPSIEKLIDEQRPDSIIIMSNHIDDDNEADARALNLLLFCKHYNDLHPEIDFGVTCEMRNVTDQKLADVLIDSDFVVSNNIAALMMSQISQNRELKVVFENILSSEGFETYIKPVKYYLDFDGETEVDLFSLSDAVAERNEIFIGYKLHSEGNGDAILVPEKAKNNRANTVTLSHGDKLVVLAKDIKL